MNKSKMGWGMADIGKLLLEIYRAAREMPVDSFPDFALGLVSALLPFSSARAMIVDPFAKGGALHSAHIFNEPAEMVLDWEEIIRQDTVFETVSSRLGRAYSFHAPSLYADVGKTAIRDYAKRYGHQNILSIAILGSNGEHIHGLSLFRSDERHHFVASECWIVENLMPHLVEALAINRLLVYRSVDGKLDATGHDNVAIANCEGILHFCGCGFEKLVRQEWPEWRSVRLPTSLLQALRCVNGSGFSGASVAVSACRIGDLLFLRASAISRLEQLSRRELAVAKLFGEGRSHKEIARDIGVSPNTVRTFLQRIYVKLGIRDKAQLAVLLARHDMPWGLIGRE